MNTQHLFNAIAFLAITLCLRCSQPIDKFHLEKPFWDGADYRVAALEIRRQTPRDEKYPTLTNHPLSMVFHKVINRDNVNFIASDSTLGLRFRKDALEDIFEEIQDIHQLYSGRDREDKFIYDEELVEILKFNAYLQVHYFKVGNDLLLAEADTPASVAKTVSDNQIIIIRNFNNYLDYVNYEGGFGDAALENYATSMDEVFGRLKETFPDADYSPTISKAKDMLAKAKDARLKVALEKLLAKLNRGVV